MLFQNILVPWDGSKLSNRAVKEALDIATKYHSKVTGITCIDVVFRGHWYYESDFYREKLAKQKEVIKKQTKNFEEYAAKNNIPFEFKIFETRSSVEQIVSYAKSKKIDFIVMGSHGRTGFRKIVLGSVANGVLGHAKCPVLITKGTK